MYNRVIYELTRKRTEEFNDEDKRIVKEELDRYRRSRIPIYPYIYRREIYFRIVFRNRSLRGFDTFEKAEDIYRRLAFGETELDDAKAEIKVKRKVLLVTLKDGYRILMKKHEAAYQNGELKYSSYNKKDTTIRYHILPFFENKPVAQITRGDIAHFVHHIRAEEKSNKTDKDGKAKKLSVGMQHEVLMYFKMLFKETIRWFDVETEIDVDKEVEMPKMTKTRKKYSKEVGEKLSGNYKDSMKIIIQELAKLDYGIYNPAFGIQLMISCTGMRIDEANALKPCKFNYEKKTLLIDRSISWHPDRKSTRKSWEETSTKTDAERTILLPDSIAEYLKAYIDRLKKLTIYSNKMYLFCRLGLARRDDLALDPYSLKTFDNKLIEINSRCGLMDEDDKHKKEKNHLARHAFNTMLKNGHIDEYDRKVYLGHSVGTDVHAGYTHSSAEEERRIIEIGEEFCLFLTADIPEFRALVKR